MAGPVPLLGVRNLPRGLPGKLFPLRHVRRVSALVLEGSAQVHQRIAPSQLPCLPRGVCVCV